MTITLFSIEAEIEPILHGSASIYAVKKRYKVFGITVFATLNFTTF